MLKKSKILFTTKAQTDNQNYLYFGYRFLKIKFLYLLMIYFEKSDIYVKFTTLDNIGQTIKINLKK